MKIAVIIVHFGDVQVTKNCIESLQKNETEKYLLIIVNNAKTQIVRKGFSENAIVISNKENLGFAGGVNIGIRYALKKKTDAVLLLNNDTKIEKPFIKKLLDVLYSNKKIGIVSPAVRFFKNRKTVYDIGGSVNHFIGRTSHKEVEKLPNKNVRDVQYVSGCCMMIKKDVFQKIGLFDDAFFLYYEDVDFCLRAQKAKFITKVVMSAIIDHELSKSAGKMSRIAIYFLTKSSVYFGEKYFYSGITKYAHRLFVLYQSFVFFVKSPYGISAWKALMEE